MMFSTIRNLIANFKLEIERKPLITILSHAWNCIIRVIHYMYITVVCDKSDIIETTHKFNCLEYKIF